MQELREGNAGIALWDVNTASKLAGYAGGSYAKCVVNTSGDLTVIRGGM